MWHAPCPMHSMGYGACELLRLTKGKPVASGSFLCQLVAVTRAQRVVLAPAAPARAVHVDAAAGVAAEAHVPGPALGAPEAAQLLVVGRPQRNDVDREAHVRTVARAV